MPDSWTFRPFRLSDAPRLAAWLDESTLPASSALDEELEWARRLLADPRIEVEVLQNEGEAGGPPRVLGFLRLDLAPDRSAEITLLVDPERRRRGIGRFLCDHALEFGRRLDLQRLVAVVAEENTAARELFTGAGYDWNGSVPGHHRFDRLIHASGTADPLEIEP
ncbi:MAG: N-acetyltransferase [Planctomycetota bacterium]